MAPFLNSNADKIVDALNLSFAVIEFDVDGNILKANKNFCDLMGYSEAELRGKHHRIFLDPDYAASKEYTAFWNRLRGGDFVCSEFMRLAKNGSEIFIRGNYNPIKSRSGKVLKIIKFANDITETKMHGIDTGAKIDAIAKAQAVIEFKTDGTVLTANENFLTALGYTLAEIVGKNHSMFVDPAFRNSPDYAEMWRKLNAGHFIADEFKRVGKGGRSVFIQASYNPVFDFKGRVIKVVKFATDVTDRVENVERLATALTNLAEGDLSQNIDKPFIASLEKVRRDFNAASVKLRGAMKTVLNNAETISAGAHEIRTAADDLAKRTEQQAASIEETAAALEEITTTVKDSSRRAEDSGQLVARAKSHADRSGQIVNEAVVAMDKINQSSSEISNIIGVIDEIAFQTNLLALNAGVEAARAGEAGKGFAVVAQEVRELAQRSASAAKEIKSLITASGAQVASGVTLVSKAGEALQEIAANVQDINKDILAIIESAREQSTALSEINQAINTVDQGTQQNAAMVEEQTAASHGLAEEAKALFALLEQFKFAEHDRVSLAGPSRSAKPGQTHQAPRAVMPRLSTQGNAALKADWNEF
ncbi:PAS domain-containing methyl-accepting chemotaxis protein [Rhizobium sp. SSA_523]|uniref:methyl-accepting chemotaxis protein n=1 Tax=Rhizobium sp. SSA_523 TaxID=2952477 RepID=UPI0020903881|nr:PAS domain-containing methyl-accepting chemotaxis protein [Rhizobium sp. SSA_523]MCO5732163.1 PAS domain-containing methyl-accepting chemotaxis protein [Rhizobium sp. SSA_523]WKC21422.1 PAS domain-containing methyl-accepting chemotaxis protein [Rhizobium sp. SSA_523]